MKINQINMIFYFCIPLSLFSSETFQKAGFNAQQFMDNAVQSWNAHKNTGTKTIMYCPDVATNVKNKTFIYVPNIDKNIQSNEYYEYFNLTLFFSGLVNLESTKRFSNNRNEPKYKNQYPGPFVVGNGPVNNHVEQESALVSWLKKYSMLRKIVPVHGALPYAFNYQEEARYAINLWKLFADCGTPIHCQQAICYGFQTIVCGLHGLLSTDEKAQEIRKELNVDEQEAHVLVNNICLIIAQAPMMRVSDSIRCIIKSGVPNTILAVQLGLIIIGFLLQRRRILNDIQVYLFGACILGMNFLKIPYCTEKLGSCLTPLVMRFIMPFLSPAIRQYEGDLSLLLKDLADAQVKTNFPYLTLFVTHQVHDEFVGPLAENDKTLLKKVFAETILVESNEKTHLHESREQVAVENVIRCRKEMAHCNDSALLKMGKNWCEKNNVAWRTEKMLHDEEL